MQLRWCPHPFCFKDPTALSIPFVGFLWMQQLQIAAVWKKTGISWLSIPFVGFLWMQLLYCSFPLTPQLPKTLNSLCGISLNATRSQASQPCRKPSYRLSIPFVGFLWMQQIFCISQTPLAEASLSIPFVGFLWMQHDLIIALHALVSKWPELSIPFVGFLWMQPGNK